MRSHPIATAAIVAVIVPSLAQAQPEAEPSRAADRFGPTDPRWVPAGPGLPPRGTEPVGDPGGEPTPAPTPATTRSPNEPAAARRARLGVVRGRITDAESGEALAGATVTVVRGGDQQVKADAEGVYELSLPPGTYELRVYSPIYRHHRVRSLLAVAGRTLTLDIAMQSSDEAVEEIIVYAEPETHTEAGMLQLRRESASVADGLSAQEMSRGGDSSASDAVKRIVSATVEDGRYVLIRGLGGRYVSTLLNGVTLPSPEPDRQAVPLDLFPTSLLANLNILKSYSARHPGTFGGGTMLIETNTYPDELTVEVKASTSADSATTLEPVLGYSGGSLDFFGFDDGSRALPGAVPSDQPARISDGIDPQTMESIGESFQNVWSLDESRGYPNLGVGLTVGDTITPRGRELGYLATVGYGHKLSSRSAAVAKVRTVDDSVEYREELRSSRGSESAKIGGLAAAGLELSRTSELHVVSLFTHDGKSSAQRVSGVNETDGMEVDATRLRFVERQLSFTQLQGRHRFPDERNLELAWQGNLSFTSRNEPDTRDITYNLLGDGRTRFKNETGSGERFFSELSEQSIGAGGDASLELGRVHLSSGTMVQHSGRAFSARRFRYAFVGTDPAALFLPADEIFREEHIGPDFRLEERTLQSDAYEADLLIYAGYGEAEVEATDDLRLTAGLRYEVAGQSMTPGSPFALGEPMPEDAVDRTDQDLLPAAAVVYALSPQMNLRGAYSYTVARPKFRELAPFLYFDYTRRNSVSGNPDLVTTHIHNADARWEWFTGDTDLVAASAFYKRFVDPIEQVIVSASGGDVSFANAARADAVGLELEARVSLDRITPRLRGFRSWANLTWIRSEVALTDEQLGSQTSAERPLQGQSPFVVNLGVSYDRERSGTSFAALYNVFGKRISEVGFDSLPDVYEEPFHRVDVTASQRVREDLKLKVSASNILNQDVVLDQGGLSVFRYAPGVGLSASLEWSP